MNTHPMPSDDEPAKDTPFCKALRCRVHTADEAFAIAATHRRHAAEARSGMPAVIGSHQDRCRATALEQRALNHDEIVAVCLRHAARLEPLNQRDPDCAMTTHPDMAVPERVVVNGVAAEVMPFRCGRWYFRCPQILPVNARHWHGPHADRQAAIDDLEQRTALPVLTRKQVEAKRCHGYFGETGGVPVILHLCRLTGATVLTPFVLAEETEP